MEVLKLLQKSYYGKVKMIYIDPPYNTGKEFIYPDKYQENLDTYLAYTGQVDDEGYKFSTNAETEGRYHSNWLNMMYPRLFLARNLLQDDGAICSVISAVAFDAQRGLLVALTSVCVVDQDRATHRDGDMLRGSIIDKAALAVGSFAQVHNRGRMLSDNPFQSDGVDHHGPRRSRQGRGAGSGRRD